MHVRARLEGHDVVIEVHNQGEPIPADRLDKVFAPFWRRTASREGLGLGLYICSQIARSHGGHADGRVVGRGGHDVLGAPADPRLSGSPGRGFEGLAARRRPIRPGSTTISHPRFPCQPRAP